MPGEWIRVPVGEDSTRWTTRGGCRQVLLVVHNVTSATRLLDVVGLFRDDLRVQLTATCPGTSPFRSGLPELLAALGVPVLPWEQALAVSPDLAVSASFGGRLREVKGALAIISHGVGYNKKLATTGSREPGAGSREPGAGSREPGAGSREPGAGSREPGKVPTFGMSPEWLLDEHGEPIADALVLSHPDQLDRLAAACPEAAHTGVLGGDPCFDRILAALPRRDAFRRAFGVRSGQRLLVLNSTWNPTSLFGDGGPDDVLPLLLSRLPELPLDDYRVAVVLHPNVWHGHGPGQVRLWLDGARRAGVALVDPVADWRQALIAADAVVGDFGSVSYYAAALGTPVVLAATGPSVIDDGSQVAAFVREAPGLDPYTALGPQLDALLDSGEVPSGPGELTSSDPGRSAALLRSLFYRFLGLTEPPGPALLDPLPLPAYQPAVVTAPVRVLTRTGGDGAVEVRRFAAARHEPAGPGAAHLVVHEDTLDPGALALADVIVRHGDAADPRLGPPLLWAEQTLRRHRSCALAVQVTGPATCTVRHRSGAALELAGDFDGVDPAAAASALLAAGLPAAGPLPGVLTVRSGTAIHRVTVTPAR
ncbi:hypothetical protein KSE_73810 [Kitasatospora setae KM-6054]|uniref:Translation initiation factor 2 n=1 Tax=Kitasatospora setae (strain ATCC 33774 / DSM 43861 / JCM 3304 / KCC A-0304 / NBRC 14216 / KM-6054) TaxID=452652 RepID=E4NJI8_KITSK|nr:hypothetical protein [Kitasatospora sp. SID7827]BAJ33136.1 hypothetical protein KSE_73810 [Kitasatospora setae KM-6054]